MQEEPPRAMKEADEDDGWAGICGCLQLSALGQGIKEGQQRSAPEEGGTAS